MIRVQNDNQLKGMYVSKYNFISDQNGGKLLTLSLLKSHVYRKMLVHNGRKNITTNMLLLIKKLFKILMRKYLTFEKLKIPS